MTDQNNAAQAAEQEIDAIMEQAQVFASAWSFLGGPFDNGSGLETAERERTALRAMLSKLRTEGVQAVKAAGHSEVARCTAPSMQKNHVDCDVPSINRNSNHGDLPTTRFSNMFSSRTSCGLDIRIDHVWSRHEMPCGSPDAQMDDVAITSSRACDAINGTNSIHDNSTVQHNLSFSIWRTSVPSHVKGYISLQVPQAGGNTYLHDKQLECPATKDLQASAPVAGEAQPVCWIERAQLENVRDEGDDAWVYWRGTGHAAEPDEVPLYAAPQASEAVRDAALEEAASLLERNRKTWVSVRAAYEIRALKSHSAALSAQPGAQKGGSDAE
ncbi:hypothetical protein [Achromobacter sp. Bel]|uniref:hypothetical protein n=1 Tax=Achromobacter sp. Bel TaxID=2727415 RepID=UPI00145D86AD|nr:hypothetical protein [Achromobacter sp. Bel]NMK45553.1 hypothetical protein [Achromobacter sp. Bel]